MKKILIIDNYDSFTYNLYHLIGECGYKGVEVIRNDKIRIEEIDNFDKIILSPGPGIPEEAGLLLPVIREYAATKSMLGICLGHQAIGQVFGGELKNLENVYHGIQSTIHKVEEDYIFDELHKDFQAGRYHSWIIDKQLFPEDLTITAVSDENQIMAIKHKTFDVHGVQFHPESILTPNGKYIINNFLNN